MIGYIGAGRAGKAVSNANMDAMHGVSAATGNGQQHIYDTLQSSAQNLSTAGDNVNAAKDQANANLQTTLDNTNAANQPYMQSGQQGNKQLQDYAASNPQFKFNINDYMNSPAYKFQLEQGQDAITNKASAMGLAQGGNVLKDLTTFGQGLASTYYGQAFNQAQSQFQTNQNATMQNIQTLLGAGEFGTNQYNNANLQVGGQQSRNITDAAGTNANIQMFNSGLQLQGNESAADLGLKGADTAGKYAVGAGQATATGIMNQGAALSAGIEDILGGPIGAVGGIPLPGGGKTTVAGLFGGR